ncbi:MAG: MFS transporter [Pseudomonadota bacterium]
MRLTHLTILIAAGAIMLAISHGMRGVFGVILDPVSTEFGWPRSIYSLSLAIQIVMIGLAQPLFGWIADRWGDRAAMWLGFVLYVIGMLLTVWGGTEVTMHLGTGVLIGMGVSGTAMGLVLAAVGRAVPEERRTRVLSTVAAFGAVGTMILPWMSGQLVAAFGWQTTILIMTAILLPMALCIPFMKADLPATAQAEPMVPTGQMMGRMFGYSSYLLIVLGFFVCGFHVAFISAHFPAFVAEMCATAEGPATELGALSLSLVGVANFFATILVGRLASYVPRPYLLSGLYALRSLAILVFVSIPVTPTSVIIFSLGIGAVWLATVPLTSGIVATMFGPRYIGTTYGFVFLSHQVGGFIGIYLGGEFYDRYGNYDIIWWAAIGLGVLSAIVHLPLRDKAWQAKPA